MRHYVGFSQIGSHMLIFKVVTRYLQPCTKVETRKKTWQIHGIFNLVATLYQTKVPQGRNFQMRTIITLLVIRTIRCISHKHIIRIDCGV